MQCLPVASASDSFSSAIRSKNLNPRTVPMKANAHACSNAVDMLSYLENRLQAAVGCPAHCSLLQSKSNTSTPPETAATPVTRLPVWVAISVHHNLLQPKNPPPPAERRHPKNSEPSATTAPAEASVEMVSLTIEKEPQV